MKTAIIDIKRRNPHPTLNRFSACRVDPGGYIYTIFNDSAQKHVSGSSSDDLDTTKSWVLQRAGQVGYTHYRMTAGDGTVHPLV